MGDSGELILYNFPLGMQSKMARLVLEEKAVEYESREVNELIFDQYRPEYVRLADCCTLPVLVHGEDIISEITDILRYIDYTYPDGPLQVEEGTEEEELLKKWMSAAVIFPFHLVPYALASGLKAQIWSYSIRERAEFLKKLLPAAGGLREIYQQELLEVQDIVDLTEDKTGRSQLVNDLEVIMDELEDRLRASKYLVSDEYTLADLAWTAVLSDLEQQGLAAKLWQGGKRPAVARFFASVKRRPSFASAIADIQLTGDHLGPFVRQRVMGPLMAGVGVVGLGLATLVGAISMATSSGALDASVSKAVTSSSGALVTSSAAGIAASRITITFPHLRWI
eukprot:Clim_evm1s203 gene=Clim_evmTU1s203